MPLVPQNWSVIIAGQWNRAILTPRGIAVRLFELEEGTPVLVEVPIDVIGPHRVTHEGITVSVTSTHLAIETQQQAFDTLERAMRVGRRALDNLPETPISAVGINLRYHVTEPAGDLGTLLTHPWDDVLSDAQFVISGRAFGRTLEWHGGQVNFAFVDEDNELKVLFNIERKSSVKDEHVEWLNRPINDVEGIVTHLIQSLNITPADFQNG
jgi:prepilin-type processing-associated H-X9-DG protein